MDIKLSYIHTLERIYMLCITNCYDKCHRIYSFVH